MGAAVRQFKCVVTTERNGSKYASGKFEGIPVEDGHNSRLSTTKLATLRCGLYESALRGVP